MVKNMARTRRQRGFTWERQVAKILKGVGLHALRLGGSGLPDVIATAMDYSRSYVIECKSGYKSSLYVDIKQVLRQKTWITEALLPNPVSVFSFKFASGHAPVYLFWLMPYNMEPCGITCRNDGVVTKTGSKTVLGHCHASLETLIRRDLAEEV